MLSAQDHVTKFFHDVICKIYRADDDTYLSQTTYPLRSRNAGLTLLEILVVLAIIALVTTLATPRLMETYGRAKSQAAGVQITNVSAAVQVYALDTGQLPSQADGLAALMVAPAGVEGWQGPYVEAKNLKDPWGRDWVYRQPGAEAPFEVVSYGADGQPGGTSEDADITE